MSSVVPLASDEGQEAGVRRSLFWEGSVCTNGKSKCLRDWVVLFSLY